MLLQSLLAASGTAAPWFLHGHLTLGTGEGGAVLGADTPPVEAAAALTGFLPFGSRRVGMPMAPALAAVRGHAVARVATQVPVPAHAPRGLPHAAGAPSLCGVGLLARLFTWPQLPRRHLLPHFSRRALVTVSWRAVEGSISADTAGAVPGQHSPWGKLPGLLLKG